jgi:hypothetical protein
MMVQMSLTLPPSLTHLDTTVQPTLQVTEPGVDLEVKMAQDILII